MENNKYKNAVVIEVTEDFNPGLRQNEKGAITKVGRVIYKKGSKHAVHQKLLPKLEKKGLKFKKVNYDFVGTEKKAADKLKKTRETK